jgi:hypothetical protein
MIPPDPSALAKTILKQITIDKTEIRIDSSKASLQEIQLSNGMLGVVRIAIDNVGQPGLGVKADRTVLRPKERARILVHYDPNDPALMCSDCLKRTEGTTVATIHVSPTNQVFNIKIIFERPSAKVQ